MAERLTIVAPAKVNLYLEVGERRADGYHDVVTVLQALELHDALTMEPADRFSVTCVPDLGLPDCDNLAAVAGRVLGGVVDREPAAAVHISKHIPVGGGLGGGSADAAATLAGLARVWGLPADDPRLTFAARAIGMDVPFFLSGGTALYRGRGDERVTALPTPPLDIAIVSAGSSVSTRAAYDTLDARTRRPAPGPAALVAAVSAGDGPAVAAALHNDMADAATALAPSVGEVLGWVREQTGVLGSDVAGSGSSVFGICDGPASAAAVARAARARGWWAAATKTRGAGVAVESSAAVGPEVGA